MRAAAVLLLLLVLPLPGLAQTGKPLVAVVPFGDRTLYFGRAGEAATLEVETRLRTIAGIAVIAGAYVERVAREQGLDVPGVLASPDAARLARALGVDAAVTGEVTNLEVVAAGFAVGPVIVQPAGARVSLFGRVVAAGGQAREARIRRTTSGGALAVGTRGVAVGTFEEFTLRALLAPAVEDLIRALDPARP